MILGVSSVSRPFGETAEEKRVIEPQQTRWDAMPSRISGNGHLALICFQIEDIDGESNIQRPGEACGPSDRNRRAKQRRSAR